MLQTYNLSNFYIPESFINTHFREKKPYPQIQILRYMGNKRGLLNWLMPILEEQLGVGDTVLDLFAGTSSVGYALKAKNKIIANDIQEYSTVISKALLEFNETIEENDFIINLHPEYKKNFIALLEIYGSALEDERNVLKNNNVSKYQQFSDRIPKYGHLSRNDRYHLNFYCKESFINERRRKPQGFPYMLFCIYYPNTFFSLEQCIEVDSLRYAIENVSKASRKAVYLSCLMYAISKAVNSSGHFAEYLNHNSIESSHTIFEQRQDSVLKHFLIKLSEFKNLYIQEDWENESCNYDWKDAIKHLSKQNKLKDIKLIYIDPPYTSAQYSRFYHIPETLVKYDYPKLTLDKTTGKPVKGGYRNDRIQSSFSKITAAEQAFSEIFATISKNTRSTLAISYSDNSLVKPVDRLVDIASNYYQIVKKINGHSHSAQGSRFRHNGRGNHLVNEYVLICKRK